MAAKPIYKPSWMDSLRQAVSHSQQAVSHSPDRPLRIAVLGIGSELRGDDAVGALAAQRLRDQISSDQVLVIDGGAAPENCTGALRHFHPDLLLVIDAAEIGLPPGSIDWLNWEQTAGLSASTHTLPLHILLQFLRLEIGCEAALIGIQPVSTAFNAPMSASVRQAMDQVVEGVGHAIVAIRQRGSAESGDQ